jgi:hypothetical protein
MVVVMEHPEFDEPAVGRAAREAIEYVERGGWGQPPQLFALVPTALLSANQPEWSDLIDDGAELTLIEQEPLPGDPHGGSTELEHMLGTTSWPEEVVGCVLVQEIIVLPPEAESALDGALAEVLHDDAATDRAGRAAAAAHPGRRTARMAVGVLAGGPEITLLQMQPEQHGTEHEDPFAEPELLRADGTASGLAQALRTTFDNEY